jgi:SAM-dependent methyltransferase
MSIQNQPGHSSLERIYLWLTERLYNEFSWAYDPVSWLVSLGQWDEIRKLALPWIIGPRILEIGFGTGELLIELTQRGYQVIGLDLSLAMQQQVNRKLSRIGLEVPRLCSRVQESPIQPGIFDSILSTFPAQFILDPLTWQECARLLRSSNNGVPARLVVVGLWIKPARKVIKKEFIRYENQQKEVFFNMARSVGMQLTIEDVRYKNWLLPVLIAEKSY